MSVNSHHKYIKTYKYKHIKTAANALYTLFGNLKTSLKPTNSGFIAFNQSTVCKSRNFTLKKLIVVRIKKKKEGNY